MKARVQRAETTARQIGQIAGVNDRRAVKTGKKQTEQFDAGRIDGRA
jgi:hypothetical protein